jgi:hypothetical protein
MLLVKEYSWEYAWRFLFHFGQLLSSKSKHHWQLEQQHLLLCIHEENVNIDFTVAVSTWLNTYSAYSCSSRSTKKKPVNPNTSPE